MELVLKVGVKCSYPDREKRKGFNHEVRAVLKGRGREWPLEKGD